MAAMPQGLSELLARNGVRATPRRLEVLEELAQERDDVTAQQLWTVYATATRGPASPPSTGRSRS